MTERERLIERIIGAASTLDPPARRAFIALEQFLEAGFQGAFTRIPLTWTADELVCVDVFPDHYVKHGRIKVGY